MREFKPNVELFDEAGESRGLYLRERFTFTKPELALYTSEDVWAEGGRPISSREVAEWGWTVREVAP